jgi:hypothetical protein
VGLRDGLEALEKTRDLVPAIGYQTSLVATLTEPSRFHTVKALTVVYTNRYNILLLDFVHRVTHIQTLKQYVSEAGSASVFRKEAPNLLDPLDQAVLSHWVPLNHSRV